MSLAGSLAALWWLVVVCMVEWSGVDARVVLALLLLPPTKVEGGARRTKRCLGPGYSGGLRRRPFFCLSRRIAFLETLSTSRGLRAPPHAPESSSSEAPSSLSSASSSSSPTSPSDSDDSSPAASKSESPLSSACSDSLSDSVSSSLCVRRDVSDTLSLVLHTSGTGQ